MAAGKEESGGEWMGKLGKVISVSMAWYVQCCRRVKGIGDVGSRRGQQGDCCIVNNDNSCEADD